MSVRYYSQSGEDALAWSFFKDEPPGFFIEVGAFDGRHGSNTLLFEEQGWRGICVEPHPEFFPFCRANRPGSVCVNVACVGRGHSGNASYLSEPLGVLSGIRADQTLDMEGRYAARGMTFPGFTAMEVPAQTLDEVLAKHCPDVRRIDFLSIDVEGTEIDVLEGLSREARLVVAEANTEQERDRLTGYMKARGYSLARSILQNYFFSAEPGIVDTLSKATFDIVTERTLHPLGRQATHPLHAGRRHILTAEGHSSTEP